MSILTQYRERHRLTQEAFASLVGIDQSVVCRIERGNIRPSGKTAAKIERVTGGEIPAVSWFSEDEGQQVAQ